MATAEAMTLAAHGPRMTYSRKVFIPLTKLCRDVCHYCTFATTPGRIDKAYLAAEDVLAIARAGVAAGCREALSRSGIDLNFATEQHATPWPDWGTTRPFPISAKWQRSS